MVFAEQILGHPHPRGVEWGGLREVERGSPLSQQCSCFILAQIRCPGGSKRKLPLSRGASSSSLFSRLFLAEPPPSPAPRWLYSALAQPSLYPKLACQAPVGILAPYLLHLYVICCSDAVHFDSNFLQNYWKKACLFICYTWPFVTGFYHSA